MAAKEYALIDDAGVVQQVIVADAAFIAAHPQKSHLVLTAFDPNTGAGKVGPGYSLLGSAPTDKAAAAVFESPSEKAARLKAAA